MKKRCVRSSTGSSATSQEKRWRRAETTASTSKSGGVLHINLSNNMTRYFLNFDNVSDIVLRVPVKRLKSTG